MISTLSNSKALKDLCNNTGNWIDMCDGLSEVTRHEYGDIRAQPMSHCEINSSRLQIVAGRFKKNRIILNYCPFCGVDIRTVHKDKKEETPNSR